MGKFKYDLTVFAVDAFGAACTTALFGLCWFSFYKSALFAPFHLEGWCVSALFCLVYCLLCRAYDSFEVVLQSVLEAVFSRLFLFCSRMSSSTSSPACWPAAS